MPNKQFYFVYSGLVGAESQTAAREKLDVAIGDVALDCNEEGIVRLKTQADVNKLNCDICLAVAVGDGTKGNLLARVAAAIEAEHDKSVSDWGIPAENFARVALNVIFGDVYKKDTA